MLLQVLDLIGCFAFAFYGAGKGIQAQFSGFGVYACGFLMALGGGTIREIMLGEQPVYFYDHMYLYGAILGSTLAILWIKPKRGVRQLMLVADAIGLVAFAWIGAARAEAFGLGLAMMGVFAVLTAVGGGVLADIVTRQSPAILKRHTYMGLAIVTALLYFVSQKFSYGVFVEYLILVSVFGMRMLDVHRQHIRLSIKRLFSQKKLPAFLQE